MGFEITGLRTIYNGWTTLRMASLKTPSGEIIEREIEDHGSAVCVLPYDPVRKTAILVRQFRPPVGFANGEGETLEAIAGIVEDENPEAAAIREAWEEAGVTLGALERIGALWTMPGISTERMTFYLAPYTAAQKTGDGGGLDHEHENITVEELALSDLAVSADNGTLSDQKTYLLLQTLRLRKPELFTR